MKFVRKYWINIAAILILSAIGFLCIFFTYLQGLDMGREIGNCETTCKMTNGKLLAVIDGGECQCQSLGEIKWVYSVDVIK